MSSTTSSAVSSATVTAPGRAAPTRGRRWVWPSLVAAAVLTVGLVTATLTRADIRDGLDPRSASPGGSHAVAQILRAQGVRVDVATRADDAVRGAGPATTVLVVNPELLGPEQLSVLRSTPVDLVLVEPDLVVLDALAPALAPAGSARARPAGPACADPDAVAAGIATGGGRLYTEAPAAAGIVGCYPEPRYPNRWSLARVTDGARHVSVVGQRAILQNEALATDGNAALALRLLGAQPTLRWYLPDPVELGRTGGSPALSELVPPWARWAVVQLGVVLGAVVLVRGRRFGRVVTEPLPVVVRSAETVEGRARLYRVGHARGRAAAVLRTAAARRLAARLGVPPHAGPAEVAQLAAAAAGVDPAEAHRVLLGGPPRDDAALVALAGALDALEQAVTGEARPGAPSPEAPSPGAPSPGGPIPPEGNRDRYADRPTGEGGR